MPAHHHFLLSPDGQKLPLGRSLRDVLVQRKADADFPLVGVLTTLTFLHIQQVTYIHDGPPKFPPCSRITRAPRPGLNLGLIVKLISNMDLTKLPSKQLEMLLACHLDFVMKDMQGSLDRVRVAAVHA